MIALFRDDDNGFIQSVGAAVDEMIEPFFGEEILAGRIFDVVRNKKRTGAKVYLEGSPYSQRITEGAKYLAGALTPGAFDQASNIFKGATGVTNDYGKAYDLSYLLFAQATGLKVETIDPRQAFAFRAATFSRNEQSLTGHLRKVAGRRGTVGEGEIESTYATVNRNRQQNMDAFQRQVSALSTLGVTRPEIAAIMRQANISKKHIPALLDGIHIPVQIDGEYLSRQFERSRVQTPDAPFSKSEEVQRRLQILRRAQEKASE